ncbi:hypothetical protein J2S43_002100 [Catenuloplanes nepalensis]|uniref:Uncharacterized protein n=1 Tax=Catenuloplanes nepalensis TaxID=587533 RepID=A0ABT9MQA4_9ACTN|nr:hypothetical protein [Catenuloplanes nepalensis]MDP9793588.1 hypothetical protein [Catenuloplanes nepalensis]
MTNAFHEGPDEAQLREFQDAPAASTSKLIDFDDASVIMLKTNPPQFILRVKGVKQWSNMKVDLVPLVYVRQPEYWGIEVVGTLSGVGLPIETPYDVSLNVTGTLGTRGVEVVGATKRERIDVIAGTGPAEGDWTAFFNRQPPGPFTLTVTGRLQMPTPGYKVTLTKTAPQGINPRDLLLDLTITPPSGPVIQVVTEVEVVYRERTESGYDTVTILPGGPSIKVEEVS